MTTEASTTASSLTKGLKWLAGTIAAIGVIWGAVVGAKASMDSYLSTRIEKETHSTKQLLSWFLKKNPEAAKSFKDYKKEDDCIQAIVNGKNCDD